MNPKLTGCCSKCDAEVFESVTRNPSTRVMARIGPPLEGATRVTFALMNGSKMDLTFCKACADVLTPADYGWLWQRVMVSWANEQPNGPPWARSQVNNGIAGLLYRQLWKEVV